MKVLDISIDKKLADLVSMLKDGSFQMSEPTLTANVGGSRKTLYLEKIKQTHNNLNKKLGMFPKSLCKNLRVWEK